MGGKGIFENQNPIKIVEDGDVFTLVESLYYYKQTQAVVQYKIYKASSRIDVKITVVLANKNIFVKAHVPIGGKQVFGGQMFGEEEVPNNGTENIVQEFIKIPFDSNSFNIALFDTYGASYDGKDLKLSLIRGTTYCAHPIGNNPLVEKDRYLQIMDLGLSEFDFTLFVDDYKNVAGIVRQTNPSYSIQLFPSGERSIQVPRFTINDSKILLEAFKRSDGGDGYILRLFNSTNENMECEVEFGDKKAFLTFDKYEVKTLEIKEDIFESSQMKI